MAFDKSLDEERFKEVAEFEVTRITVSVFSYNGGTPKLQVSRENLNTNTGEWVFAKLGRMVLSEVEKILPMIEKSKKSMQ